MQARLTQFLLKYNPITILVSVFFLLMAMFFTVCFIWNSSISGINLQNLVWIVLACDAFLGFFHYGYKIKPECKKTTLVQDFFSLCFQGVVTLLFVYILLPYVVSMGALITLSVWITIILHVCSLFFTFCFVLEGWLEIQSAQKI